MTITTTDTALVIDTNRPQEQYCAYEHLVSFEAGAPPEVIMVGMCRLTEVYRLSEGRVNSDWSRIFGGGGHVMVRIIAVGDNRADMSKFAANHIKSLPAIPRCNLHGVSTRGYARPIRCENDGMVYPSQKEAAEAYGLHASAISRHLAGNLHKVGGMVFTYVG